MSEFLKVKEKKLPIQLLQVELSSVKSSKHPAIQEIFQREEAKRIKGKTGDKLPIRTSDAEEIDVFIANSEIAADAVVNYRGAVVIDRGNQVVFGHDKVKLAKDRGDKYIQVTKLTADLKPDEIFAIQFRYGMREGQLSNMARMEAIGQLKDTYGWDFPEIKTVAVQRGSKPLSLDEIKKDFYTWQIYRDEAGFTVELTQERLDPNSYSKIKYLRGNKKIREAMDQSPELRKHFVQMAIRATNDGMKRFQEYIPRLLAHEETATTLMTKSLSEAIDQHKALFPEENTQKYPHRDLEAANEKLKRFPEARRVMRDLFEKDPIRNATLNTILEILMTTVGESPRARARVLSTLYQDDPGAYLSVANLEDTFGQGTPSSRKKIFQELSRGVPR